MVAGNLYFHHMIFSRFAYLTGFLIVTGGIWTRISINGIEFKRTSKDTRFECGQIFEENYEIINNSIYPKIWVRVDDQSDLPSKPASRVVTLIKPHQKRYFQTLLILANRGEYDLGATEISCGDPFGLFLICRIFHSDKKILVFPLIFALEGIIAPQGSLSGGKAHRESIMDATPNASGVRDYQPGDPLNRIHWRTSVRKQRWFVREFDQDPQSNLWILLDGYKNNHFHIVEKDLTTRLEPREAHSYKPERILPKDNFEYGVCIAASLSQYFLKEGRALGLICAGQQYLSLFPEKGERQIIKILENLSYIMPSGNLPFSVLLQTNSDMITNGNSVILITSSRNIEIRAALDILIRKGIPIIMIIIDPYSFGATPVSDNSDWSDQDLGIPSLIIKSDEDLSKSINSQLWGIDSQFHHQYPEYIQQTQ